MENIKKISEKRKAQYFAKGKRVQEYVTKNDIIHRGKIAEDLKIDNRYVAELYESNILYTDSNGCIKWKSSIPNTLTLANTMAINVAAYYAIMKKKKPAVKVEVEKPNYFKRLFLALIGN